MNKVLIALVLIAAAAGGAWYYLQLSQETPSTQTETAPAVTPEPVAPAPMPEPEEEYDDSEITPAEPSVQSPPEQLEGSDDAVAAAINDLTGAFSARIAKWIVPKDQIRRWVAAVDAAADGELPQKHAPLNRDIAAFSALGEQGQYSLDPNNYQRLDSLISAVTAMDAQQVAAYYRAWRPLFEAAYAELGKEGDFDSRLRQALRIAVDVPVITGDIALERPSVYYTYASDAREASNGVSKLMWRMGPENAEKLQEFLTALLVYL